MIIVSGQVLPIDEQIVVLVQLPEFAVNDVKVLITEEVGDLVDVIFFLEKTEGGQQIGPPQLAQSYESTPRTIDDKEDSSYHL